MVICLVALLILLTPSAAYACMDGGLLEPIAIMPYVVFALVAWGVKGIVLKLAAKLWLYGDILKADLAPLAFGAAVFAVNYSGQLGPRAMFLLPLGLALFYFIFLIAERAYFNKKLSAGWPQGLSRGLVVSNALGALVLVTCTAYFKMALQC